MTWGSTRRPSPRLPSSVPSAAAPSALAWRGAWRQLVRIRVLLFERGRYGRLALERVGGRPLLVLPQVFNPALFASGRLLAAEVERRADLLPPGARVLDLGTGSGIGAIAAAAKAQVVVATDVNPHAVRCARINVLLNEVEARVDVRCGDLFGPLGADERFDVVLFNPPYYRGTPRSPLDQAWRSPDVIELFARDLTRVLTPGGHALVVLSSDGEQEAFLEAFRANDLRVEVAAERDLIYEKLTLYRVRSQSTGVVGRES